MRIEDIFGLLYEDFLILNPHPLSSIQLFEDIFEGKNFQLRTFSVIFQFWKEREYVGEREMCCNVKDIVINTVLPLCPEPSFVERVRHVVHLDM